MNICRVENFRYIINNGETNWNEEQTLRQNNKLSFFHKTEEILRDTRSMKLQY